MSLDSKEEKLPQEDEAFPSAGLSAPLPSVSSAREFCFLSLLANTGFPFFKIITISLAVKYYC